MKKSNAVILAVVLILSSAVLANVFPAWTTFDFILVAGGIIILLTTADSFLSLFVKLTAGVALWGMIFFPLNYFLN